MTMSSLVQRQSERQGIFLIALSPLERGAGGVKYQPYPTRCDLFCDRYLGLFGQRVFRQ